MQRSVLLSALSVALLLASCSSKTATGGACQGNQECEAGQVCNGGECLAICRTDRDCGTDLVCTDGLCATGQRDSPRIDTVDGDGAIVCPDAMGTHCIEAGMTVQGANLEGATFTLLGDGGTPLELIVRSGSANVVALDLPDVAAGQYVLTATNGAGSADQALQLLQGPPGPDLTPNELVDHVNLATNTLSVQRLPVGQAAGLVAAGDHGHSASDLTGTVAASQLPVGTGASDVAAGNHGHSYLPLSGGDVSGSLTVGGEGVCLADGTNCPDKQTYTTWGTTTCGSGHTRLYTGRIASTVMTGGGAGAFCLSDAITTAGWITWNGGMIWRANASTAGTRGQYSNGANTFSCAVCQGSTYVQWGSQTCAAGWSTVYSGYLGAAGGSWSGGWAPSEPFCLSSSAGSGWTNWADGMVFRGTGSSGNNRVEYQNANDVLCRVCR